MGLSAVGDIGSEKKQSSGVGSVGCWGYLHYSEKQALKTGLSGYGLSGLLDNGIANRADYRDEHIYVRRPDYRDNHRKVRIMDCVFLPSIIGTFHLKRADNRFKTPLVRIIA